MAASSEVRDPSHGGCCLPAKRAGISYGDWNAGEICEYTVAASDSDREGWAGAQRVKQGELKVVVNSWLLLLGT